MKTVHGDEALRERGHYLRARSDTSVHRLGPQVPLTREIRWTRGRRLPFSSSRSRLAPEQRDALVSE